MSPQQRHGRTLLAQQALTGVAVCLQQLFARMTAHFWQPEAVQVQSARGRQRQMRRKAVRSRTEYARRYGGRALGWWGSTALAADAPSTHLSAIASHLHPSMLVRFPDAAALSACSSRERRRSAERGDAREGGRKRSNNQQELGGASRTASLMMPLQRSQLHVVHCEPPGRRGGARQRTEICLHSHERWGITGEGQVYCGVTLHVSGWQSQAPPDGVHFAQQEDIAPRGRGGRLSAAEICGEASRWQASCAAGLGITQQT